MTRCPKVLLFRDRGRWRPNGRLFHHDHGMFTSAPLAAMPLRGMVL
jgi:hypothetical protein